MGAVARPRRRDALAIPCWTCGRASQGFGHLDLRYRAADPRRTPYRWAFCSMRCQDAFHQLYKPRHRCDPASVEELLPMTLPLSPNAQRACLHALAAVADRIGFGVPLAQYSQPQALAVIDAVIHAYESQLAAQSRPRGPDGFEDADIPF